MEKTIDAKIPMVEIFETVEGEGTRAGYLTTFIRTFHCNLRCRWCDTPYSYAPAKPEFWMGIEGIKERVNNFGNRMVCLTGGEPLIHGERSALLIEELAQLKLIEDIHIETNGAIPLDCFQRLREDNHDVGRKIRFILDYKLPASGEYNRMIPDNLKLLTSVDEIKFVIEDWNDFEIAEEIVSNQVRQGTPLFSPVWGKLHPQTLVEWMLQRKLTNVKLNLQIHKFIWDPNKRGV